MSTLRLDVAPLDDALDAFAHAWETGEGETARRVGRDVKAVHGNVNALVAAGIEERGPDDRFIFPYDAVHVDFVMRAA